MRNVVIVDGVRTGFGKLGGSLRQFSMTQLATMAIDGLLKKTQLIERGGMVEGVYMGSALHDHQTHAPARLAVLRSKLGYDTVCRNACSNSGRQIHAIRLHAYSPLVDEVHPHFV